MTDLFQHLPEPKAPVGKGNALFLADLAANTPDAEMRENFKAGKYPDLHKPSLAGWKKLRGRA